MEKSRNSASENETPTETDSDSGPISALVSKRGIKTSADFADFMSGLMDDVVTGRVQPETAKAACIAGDQLLKVARMQLEYEGLGPVRLSGPRIGETENKKLSGACGDCGFPRNSQNHMTKCRKGINED